MRAIELLAPAADKYVAKQAILHGADAVYIGAMNYGARKRASNSLEDIKETVEFAHKFRARVYVTVNTIIYEEELKDVQSLIIDLYRIGVDAVIVQDMALLMMDIPPIALHSSTQCDTRTVGKARFLEDVGFSQLVLARELTIPEIKKICDAVTVPVECFIHGALCVCYSGRCSASQYATGRSANRGECVQMCRLPYTLCNSYDEIVEEEKYLLSLRDLNASTHIGDLLEAGVSSFKIEGRLKDASYVKNITAYYRRLIDKEILRHPDRYRRASFGDVVINFEPIPEKSFNRGFTSYFLDSRIPDSQASILTPKSLGEPIEDINKLHNGDGISFFDSEGRYDGMNVNAIIKGRIKGSRDLTIPSGSRIYRTFDNSWAKLMAGDTAQRTIGLSMTLDRKGLTITDDRGLMVKAPYTGPIDKARTPQKPENILGKLGGTIYRLKEFHNKLNPDDFIPASGLAALRRVAITLLDEANITTYKFEYRRPDNPYSIYPVRDLDVRSNIANEMAECFYRKHGVVGMARALECGSKSDGNIMTTRYCILRELGACKKYKRSKAMERKFSEPLTLKTGPHRFRLSFNCKDCEMSVMTEE